MKVRHLILGGGIVGRIVQAVLGDESLILEARLEGGDKKLNHSYGTNYLWEPIPEIFDSVPIQIITRIDDALPTEESIRRYKNKIGKGDEKVAEWGLQFKPETQGYLVTRMPEVKALYGRVVLEVNDREHFVRTSVEDRIEYDHLISTLPLNALMSLMGMENDYPIKTIFKYKPVYVKVVDKPPEAVYSNKVFYVNYLSNPLQEPYRYCDRFGERHYESLTPIGFPHKKLYPGKIWSDPMVPEVLKRICDSGVTCFGRYGSWSPNELIHETYHKIAQWKKDAGI